MNLSKIHHVAIIVSDYEVAKDFYVNKLGFAVIRENYRPERKDWKLDLRVNEHTELEIFAEEFRKAEKERMKTIYCKQRNMLYRTAVLRLQKNIRALKNSACNNRILMLI